MKGITKGMNSKLNILLNPGGEIAKISAKLANGFRGFLGIHSPSKVFAELGEYSSEGYVLGFKDNMEKSANLLKNSLSSSFNLSPTLTGTASTHLSPNVSVVVNNNMKTDPLGQLVNNVKTFSGGAKNDYNYGYGG